MWYPCKPGKHHFEPIPGWVGRYRCVRHGCGAVAYRKIMNDARWRNPRSDLVDRPSDYVLYCCPKCSGPTKRSGSSCPDCQRAEQDGKSDDRKMRGMTLTARKLASIAHDLGLTDKGEAWPLSVKRVRAGHHQRAAGAWSWVLVDANGLEIMGSPFPASEVIKRRGEITTDGKMTPELWLEAKKG